MALIWLEDCDPFPPVKEALSEPDGLLAASHNITIERLESAYQQGIFPWYSAGQPVLWWSPNSRMVLDCESFHPSHSLSKRLRQIARAQSLGDLKTCVVTVDCAFEAVLEGCAMRGKVVKGTVGQLVGETQPDQVDSADQAGQRVQAESVDRVNEAKAILPATWITPTMQKAYSAWHKLGRVHSIETWQHGQLVGGLYGVSIGSTFFGESMFTRANDASKIALAHLVLFLQQYNVPFIDCQMVTNHLNSLGAQAISREVFLTRVAAGVSQPEPPWQKGWLNYQGVLNPINPDMFKADIQIL